MRPFTDRQSNPLPVVDNWAGPTVAIQGITDEEKALMPTGIEDVTVSADSKSANTIYDLQGRKHSNTKQKKGIFIRNNKKFIAH
jgi:ribosome-binding factor A